MEKHRSGELDLWQFFGKNEGGNEAKKIEVSSHFFSWFHVSALFLQPVFWRLVVRFVLVLGTGSLHRHGLQLRHTWIQSSSEILRTKIKPTHMYTRKNCTSNSTQPIPFPKKEPHRCRRRQPHSQQHLSLCCRLHLSSSPFILFLFLRTMNILYLYEIRNKWIHALQQ